MRWLQRAATILAATLIAMSLLLMLVLAGGVARDHWGGGRGRWDAFGLAFGMHGAGLAWPLCMLTTGGVLALAAFLAARPEARRWFRGAALLLGAVALAAAWRMEIRPPRTHEGVFLGTFIYGNVSMAPYILAVCADSAGPLPRGAELGINRNGPYEMPLMAAVELPEAGWAGSHPRNWPETYGDVHGAQYWLVHLRGRLTGPGAYGRPPVMHYRLDVDSVVSAAGTQHPDDECGIWQARRRPEW